MSFMSGMEHQKHCSVYRSQKKYSLKKLSLILFINYCSVVFTCVVWPFHDVLKGLKQQQQQQNLAILAHSNLLFFGNISQENND